MGDGHAVGVLLERGRPLVQGPSGRVEVEADPSDALSLAVLAGARITPRPELLDVVTGSREEMLGQFADERFPESTRAMVAAHRAAVEAEPAMASSDDP